MAAALLQYQACLGIMVRLQVEDLTALKRDFDAVGDRGLSLTEFVGVMLDRVSAWDEGSAVQFILDLVELFAQVDVNGDGTMEWEEFTSAIIEGGMGTASDELDWRDMQYEENALFADVLNRPPKRVQYLPEFKRLLVHDNTRPVVEIVEPATLFPPPTDGGEDADAKADASDVGSNLVAQADGAGGSTSVFSPVLSIANKFHPLCYITGYRRDQDDVRSERSPVQTLKYLCKVDLIAVSGGDLKLTFWASTILTATSMSALETPLPLAIVHTPRPQRVLEWNPLMQHLYSISADLVITVWHVVREKMLDSKGTCEVSLFTTLKQHTDLLQDLLLLNGETLVTCGMDSMIYLWDTTTLQVRATRQGHRRGVRLLTKLSNELFLTAGFECEVLGWDIGTLAVAPVFKLWGHNSPVCCIQLIQSAAFASQHERRASIMATTMHSENAPNSAATAAHLLGDQAMTVDDDGWFKWWNLANITSMENNDLEQNSNRCLQTFRIGSDKYPWKAHSLSVLNNGQTILAAGIHKLKLLQRVRLKPKVLPSSVILFNSVSFTLLSTTDREIRIWDATSGSLLRTYRNIATSDISCVDLDARQRKIVFGTQRGELIILNYMNGAILKTWTPHQLNVSALIYCKEDQCVLTASWDRSLRLYDDNASSNCLLRCVTEAHDTDIKCMAYCYAMSLVATGSADGTIKIWDYIYFLLEDTCSLSAYGLPQSDVTSLEFVEPYPMMVSGHENGLVCCWNVSPSQASALLFHYAPFLRDPASDSIGFSPKSMGFGSDEESKGGVNCCQVYYDESGGELVANDIRKGRFLLITASFDGEVCVDDLSQIISLAHLKAFRAESLPSNHFGSYNPRRRFIRHGKSAKRLKNHLKNRRSGVNGDVGGGGDALGNGEADGGGFHHASIQNSDIVQVSKWKAHQGVVRFLRIVDDPQTILTCSSDKTIRVWSFEGKSLGSLAGSQQQSAAKTDPNPGPDNGGSGWSWEIDVATSAQLKREQAEEIWEAMKAEKVKIMVKRSRSLKFSARQKRRSSIGLASSQSVPILRSIEAESITRSTNVTTNHHESVNQNEMSEDTSRLFRQLKGEATWKQSDFQLARQDAWKKERGKFQERMKRILKKKAKMSKSTTSTTSNNQQVQERPEDEGDGDVGVDASLNEPFESDGALDPASNLLPDTLSSAVQDLPFDDKDNWSVGGLNRQKQMYGNFHHENVRRNQKVLASSGSKLRKMQSVASIDLTPSSFLLRRLGGSCVIHENAGSIDPLKPVRNGRKKSTNKLGQSQPMGSLHTSASVHTLPTSSSSTFIFTETDTNVARGDAAAPQALPTSSLSHARSAPVLVSQPTIKDLFLQQRVEEEKIHRASRLLTRVPSLHAELSLPSLQEAIEPNSLEKATQKPTPLSATHRRASGGATPPSLKSRKSSMRSIDTTSKKQRIKSDAAIMRQDYFGMYSRDDVINIYRTFNKIDKDSSGAITLRELIDGAGLFGSTHLRDNVMSIFSSIDKDQSGQIDLKELCSAIFNEAPSEAMHDILRFYAVLESAEKSRKTKKKKQLTKDQLVELKQLFRLYDTDRNGDIDVDELFNALRYNEKFYEADANSGSSAGDARTNGPNITRADVERIIARFDMNTNSTLDLHEFVELFREEL